MYNLVFYRQFIFVVGFFTFLSHCMNYPVLFGDVPNNDTHITIADVTYPIGTCISRFDFFNFLIDVDVF